ncbi:PIN domain-like protein [Rhizoctonia solani]|nr:PIN domain-like protein [Rhizoctonia solani]
MGVLGIVPFLLKKCPTVIENIPNRFQALEGKTIAIDGTLVTQRLFYTVDSRPYRHVLGWYQLVQELRQHNINVICVFDGRRRTPAKQGEVDRRRLLRSQAQVRGSWEKSRYERLLSLTQTLRGLEGLSVEHQQDVLKALQTPQSLPLPASPSGEATLINIPSQGDTNNYLEQEPSTATSSLASGSPAPGETNLGQPSGHDLIDSTEPGPLLDKALSTANELPGSKQGAEKDHAQVLDSAICTGESTSEETADEGIPQTTSLPKTFLSERVEATVKGISNNSHLDAAEYSTQELDIQGTLFKASKSQTTHLDVTTAESVLESTEESGIITEDKLSARWTEAKLRIDSLKNEDSKVLTHKILDLFDHYNRTTASGPGGTILASGTGASDTPVIPISRVQLKYTQEEAKLWKQLVASSESTTVDLAHVVEMVEQFASVELPDDEVSSDKAPLEEQVEPPISEHSAKLEEQSGLMFASLVRRSNAPTALTYAESRLILEAMGIPCIQSDFPYEAEALACSLVLNGLADFVGSEDTDVLMYDAPLLRGMTNQKVPLQIIPTSVETYLGLSRAAFVDAAILMGTDFVKRLGGIGPATAWRLMHKYESIEAMLEQEPKFRPLDVTAYLEQVKIARKIFGTIPPVPAVDDVTPGHWDEQAVYDVMSRFKLQKYLDEGQVIPNALSANYYDSDSESKTLQ